MSKLAKLLRSRLFLAAFCIVLECIQLEKGGINISETILKQGANKTRICY